MLAVSASVLLGVLGLAFDMGRAFILRAELQTFADASAMGAIYQMDGTKAGLIAANTTATNGPLGTTIPNGYNFDSTKITGATATYATTLTGTYDSFAVASAPATNSYRFVKVTATQSVPLSFLAVLPGIGNAMSVTAKAVAGQAQQTTASGVGVIPYMPDAHSPANTTNFGFTQDTSYSLKWGVNGNTTCAGDAGWTDPNPQSQHGFIDVGQGNGASALANVTVYGGFPNTTSTPSSIYAGMTVSGVPGGKGTQQFNAVQTRSAQDSDQVSTTYAQYVAAGIGNRRRVVTVPVGDPTTWNGNGNGTEKVLGFANFLLPIASTLTGNNGSICGIYVGPGNLNGNSSGATDSTVFYTNVLFQ